MIGADDLRASIFVNLAAEPPYWNGRPEEVIRGNRTQTADETRLNDVKGRL